MCYRCATNPSIHHHHRHIAAVSLPLSHHGVAFTLVAVSSLPSRCHLCCRIVVVLSLPSCRCGAFAVALLWFCCPRRSVAFIVALLQFRHCCHGVAFVFVTVSLLPSRCRLHIGCSFVVAVAVSPSCRSQFYRCHRSVTFIITSSRCYHYSCVVVVPSLSHCCGSVVAIAVLPSLSHCCHFIVAIVVSPSCLSRFCRRRHSVAFTSVAVSLSPLWCRLHISRGFIVAIAVLPSHQSWFCRRHRGVAFTSVTVLSSPSWCCLHVGHGFIVTVTVLPSSFHCCCGVAFIVALSWCHRHGFVVAIVVSPSCWLQFRCCHRGVAFIVTLLRCCHHSCVIAVPSLSHRCSFVIAVAVSPSSLHHHSVIITILLSLSWCCHCGFIIASWCYRCSHIVVSLWLWLGSWSRRGCGHHGCGCGRIVVIAVVVALLWSSLLHCGCGCCGCGCVVVVGMLWLLQLSLRRCGHVVIVVVALGWSWLWSWSHHRCVVVVMVVALWLSLLCHGCCGCDCGHGHGCGCGCGHIMVVVIVASWSSPWLLRPLDRECNGQVRMPKGSGQETLTFCGCRWVDKLTQGCWTKGKCTGSWSSVACDTAAVVGVRGGTILREVLVGLLCAEALDRSGHQTIWGHSLSVELSKCPEGHWAQESQTRHKKKC